jgi:hypothetical protein
MRSDTPRLTLTPRRDATLASSRLAAVRCYTYLVERRRLRQEKEGGLEPAPDDAEGGSNGFSAKAQSSP